MFKHNFSWVHYHRVRMEAATALGDMATLSVRGAADVNAEMPAIATSALVRVYRESRYDADAGTHRPIDFSDIGEYQVRTTCAST